MIQYIILAIAFQLLFLLVYDLFLKKSTFFNQNRIYLLITPVLSFVLPVVRISVLNASIPKAFIVPAFITHAQPQAIQLEEVTVSAGQATTWYSQISVWQWLFWVGFMVSCLLFIYKLYKIYHLKKQGQKIKHSGYTEIVTPTSNLAFSFFNYMFLGDRVKQKEHSHIIAHELVHIQQKHSWDLMYFEVLRMAYWFNPLIYMYQNRISELHEFIADSQSAGTSRKQQYQQLLHEVFQTEGVSFINQFFNKSLIKKRIVMLQKNRSKKRELLKYALLIPLMAGMLVYVAACTKEDTQTVAENSVSKEELRSQMAERLQAELASGKSIPTILEELKKDTELNNQLNEEYYAYMAAIAQHIMDTETKSDFKITDDDPIVVTGYQLSEKQIESAQDVPFTVIENRPKFPGCENAVNDAECFKQKLDEHVRATFRYPEAAQAAKVQGRVYINFRINTDGTVTVLGTRGPDKDKVLQAEAIRIIESLPTLIPGKQSGIAVPVTFAYPIVFKLK